MSHGLGPRPSAFYLERQALTRSPATPAAPSGKDSNSAAGQNDPGTPTAGDGLVLGNVFAVTVSIYAREGQTLSGGGDLYCWIYNRYQGLWVRCSDLDLSLSGASGVRAFQWSPMQVHSRNGMLIIWLTNAVTVSGGGDVLVRQDGFNSVAGLTS